MMENPIEYRPVRPGDAAQASFFIQKVFNRFVAPHFSQKGIEEFLSYVRPEALAGHFAGNQPGFIAKTGPEVIGLIVLRDSSHVSLFFVGAKYQRKGVGRALFKLVQTHFRRQYPKKITVNASPNSVTAYQTMGFTPTDTEQCVNGICFVPMELGLS